MPLKLEMGSVSFEDTAVGLTCQGRLDLEIAQKSLRRDAVLAAELGQPAALGALWSLGGSTALIHGV